MKIKKEKHQSCQSPPVATGEPIEMRAKVTGLHQAPLLYHFQKPAPYIQTAGKVKRIDKCKKCASSVEESTSKLKAVYSNIRLLLITSVGFTEPSCLHINHIQVNINQRNLQSYRKNGCGAYLPILYNTK